jgi:type VII secretion protein EccE
MTSTTSTAAAPSTTSEDPGVRTGWLLPVGIGQVAVWQLAMLAVLGTVFTVDGPLAVAVIVVAALAVAATSVRVAGLCGYQWITTWVRYRLRRRATAAAATPVRALEPRLSVHTQVDRVGNRAGITSVDETSDYGVTVRVAPADHPDPERLISLLHKTFDNPDSPMSAASLVVWAMPGVATSPVPIRVHWLALRYRPEEAPWAALARGGGPDGARKTAASAALRLVSDLAVIGYAGSVLDTPELHQELLVATGADPDTLQNSGSTNYRGAETWRGWSIGELRQSCFRTRSSGDAQALIGRCVPESTFTATSYTLRRTRRDQIRAIGTVRIGIPKSQFWITPHQAARKLGLRLLPTDGSHGTYVRATLPLALP